MLYWHSFWKNLARWLIKTIDIMLKPARSKLICKSPLKKCYFLSFLSIFSVGRKINNHALYPWNDFQNWSFNSKRIKILVLGCRKSIQAGRQKFSTKQTLTIDEISSGRRRPGPAAAQELQPERPHGREGGREPHHRSLAGRGWSGRYTVFFSPILFHVRTKKLKNVV